MFCRYFLILLWVFYTISCNAQTSGWNCIQKQNGEWSCETPPQAIGSQPPEENKRDAGQNKSVSNTDIASPVVVGTKGKLQTESNKSISKPAQAVEASLVDEEPLPVPAAAMLKPVETAQQPGWDCAVNENKTWNCSLSGTDPKGQFKIMDQGMGFGLLDPAFDRLQEQTFSSLKTKLQYDPWKNCTLRLGRQSEYASQKALRAAAPLDVGADYTEVFDNEVASFYGNVFFSRADQRISANRATYDSVSSDLELQGNVLYSDEGLALFSDNAQIRLGKNQARLRHAQFIFPLTPLRGKAEVAYRENVHLSHFKEVAYTSCRPGNQDWVMHASRLKLNKLTGKGAVKHAWLEFKGVPVFYLPYLSFPLDDRRQSGLLTPSFGSNQRNGININVPFYWNIAPNFDATLWARYLSKRGGMLGGNFRYLTEMTRGAVKLEILPYDTQLKKTRWQGALENYTVFTPRLHSALNVNYVSDEEYFNDLGNSLSLNTNRHLYSYGDVVYNRPGVHFATKVDNYQTIDKSISDSNKPYRRLPQVVLNFHHAFDFMPLEAALENEFVFFQHKTNVNGQRLNVKPSLSFPIKAPGYYIKPKISGQFTQYWLQQQGQAVPGSMTRLLPIASIDSGLFFERDFQLSGSNFLHTIEPRLFYLYIPEANQDDIPLFDTSTYDFTFSQLFRENRFNGPDRIQDANQLTLAVTSRLIDSASGVQLADLSLGNIIYFRDRRVQLHSSSPIQTELFSNLIAQFNARISKNLKFQSSMQWSPQRNEIDRGNVSLRYRDEFNRILNLGYRYRVDNLGQTVSINQSDISFLLPVYNNWNIIGRWQYSILHNLTVESFIGLEKESCCWRFQILFRRFVNNINTVDQGEGLAQTAFYIQFELKGLTTIGNDVATFLENNLYGYRIPKR